ncbi:MAG: PhzF family phenazine biosynthesis protein [Solobacterium sp.]|nr:PhzF family phenazine biosynthesis protein [Solobacterium sp.]
METKQYRYVKSDAFTSGDSAGNPAACLFLGKETLAPEQMQKIAAEHKGFVMEMVFLGDSASADCSMTYYSSECEVDFCGHGTIAAMYTLVKETPELLAKPVITAETHHKGMIEVINGIAEEDAVYISAPDPVEYPVKPSAEQIEDALGLDRGSVSADYPIRLIDAGLRTLLVPVGDLETEISVYPEDSSLKAFTLNNGIDIILIFSMETADEEAFSHTRVFAPKFGYLEDPATGSGNSAFADYLLSEGLWDGHPITVEQGGNNRVFNSVKLKYLNGKVWFGGKATKKIEGVYLVMQ